MSAKDIRAAMAADGAGDVVKVAVDKWGDVYVRDVSLEESERVARAAREKFGDEFDSTQSAFATAMVLCDENGARVFDPLNEDDLAFLGKRRSRDITAILTAAAGTSEKN